MSRDENILDRHFRQWRDEGLLSPELEARLRTASAGHDLARAASVVRLALGLMGGGLLLAGLVLVVAENWLAIPAWSKLAGWAVIQALLLCGADAFGRRLPRPALAEALALAAGGWVLGGIALVSQTYQLDARRPNGLWLWLALVLPAAWVLRQRATAAVVVAAFTGALALEVAEPGSLVHAHRLGGPWLWLAIPWLAAALASWLPRPWPALRTWISAWTFVVANVFLLELGAIQWLVRSHLGGGWIVAGLGLAAAFVLPRRIFPDVWGAPTARVFVAAVFLPWALMGTAYDSASLKDGIAVALSWIAQLGLALLAIRAGARHGSPTWVNLGYLAMLAGILTRYFDFFGRYLEGGATLVATGLVLLAALYLIERSRRHTLRGGRTS